MKAMLIAALLALVAVPALGQGGYDSDTVVTASYLFPDADCETIGEDVLAAAAAAVEAFLESLPGVDDVVIVDNCGSVVLTASITFEEDVQPSEVASVITTSQDPPLPAEVASTLGEPTVTVFAPTSAPATPPPTPAPTFAGSGDVIVVTYSFDAIDCDTVDPALVADIISDIESTFSNAGGVVSVTVTTSCDNSIEFTVVIQLSPDISQQETVTLTVIANSPSSVFSTEVVSRTGLPSTELSIIDGPTAGPTSSPTAPPPTPAPTATSAPTTSAPFVCTAGPGQFCCQTDADCAPEITSQFGLFCNLGNFLCNAGPAPPGTPAPTASPPGTPAPTASPPGTPAPTSGCSAPPGQFCCATDDDCAPSVTGQFGLFCFLGNNLCNAGPAPGVPSPPGSPAPSPPGTSAPTKPSLCISALGQICCDSDAQCTEEVTGLKDLFCNLENFLCNAGPRPSAPPGSDADCNALEDQFCCATDADCAMKYTGQEGLACNSDNDLCWVPLR